MVREPVERVQYRWFFVPDFKDDNQVLILKIHHVQGDGAAIGAFLNAMQSEPKAKDVMSLNLSCLKKLIVLVTLPITTLIEGYHLNSKLQDCNPI